MLKKIMPHCFFVFYVKLNQPFSHFLGQPGFVNNMERSSLYQPIELKNVLFFFAPEIHSINFSFIVKFKSPSFLLNMNFPSVQSSCFDNNFFRS